MSAEKASIITSPDLVQGLRTVTVNKDCYRGYGLLQGIGSRATKGVGVTLREQGWGEPWEIYKDRHRVTGERRKLSVSQSIKKKISHERRRVVFIRIISLNQQFWSWERFIGTCIK